MTRSLRSGGTRIGSLALAVALVAACTDPTSHALVRRPVIGGTEAPDGAYPETVAVMDLSYGDPADYCCTGTLIAPNLVLSAAHCLFDYHGHRSPDSDIGVYFGHNAVGVPFSEILPIAKSFVPDSYPRAEVTDYSTGMGRDDDIALLVLAASVADVTPTPILPLDEFASVAQGTMLLLVGYGYTTADYSGPDGRKFYASSPAQTHSDWELIIGGPSLPDTCSGDSGGPAFLDVGGTRKVVGVTVRAFDNAVQDCGEGGIYTLAPAYLDWIDQSLATMDGGAPQRDAGQHDAAVLPDGGAHTDGSRDGSGDQADGGDGQPGGGCTVAHASTIGQDASPAALLSLLVGLLVLRRRPR